LEQGNAVNYKRNIFKAAELCLMSLEAINAMDLQVFQ
jgi:hypothetical protein